MGERLFCTQGLWRRRAFGLAGQGGGVVQVSGKGDGRSERSPAKKTGSLVPLFHVTPRNFTSAGRD